MNRRTLIIGPNGIGKTNYASALAHHFGASAVIDDYVDGAEFPDGALALSISPDYAEFAPVGTAVYFVKTKADILDLISKTSSLNEQLTFPVFVIDQKVRHTKLGITGIVQGVSQYRHNSSRVAVDYMTTQGELKTEWLDADLLEAA